MASNNPILGDDLLERLERTGRVARVASLIANVLGLPAAPESNRFLAQRLARFAASQGWDELDALIESGDTDRLRSVVAVQHSWFWRDPEQFIFLISRVTQQLQERRPLRIWTAAASAGQEPYSLAMMLLEATYPEAPLVRILATDLDAAALDLGRRGVYSEATLAHLPQSMRRWLTKAPSTNGIANWEVRPEVAQLVEFRSHDLLSLSWFGEGNELAANGEDDLFDAIFCRNVLIYFDAPYRYAVLEGLAKRLAPGGLLCLGPGETVGSARHLFDPCGRGMYVRQSKSRSAREVTPT